MRISVITRLGVKAQRILLATLARERSQQRVRPSGHAGGCLSFRRDDRIDHYLSRALLDAGILSERSPSLE